MATASLLHSLAAHETIGILRSGNKAHERSPEVMLFIIDHTHAAEHCPAGTIHPYKEFANDLSKAAAKNDVKILEGYVDGPGHHIYFVVEAKDSTQLYNFATPLMNVGHTHVAPAMKWNKAVEQTRKQGRQK
jgi:hypothetical protein